MVHTVAESRHTHAENVESSRSQNRVKRDASRLPQRESPGAFHGAAPALACALALCFLNDASSFHISATIRSIRPCSGSLGRVCKPQQSLLAQTRSFALLASQPLAAKPYSEEERRPGRAVRLAQAVGDPDEKGGVAVALRTLFRALAVLFRQTMRVLNRIDVQLVVYFVLWYSGNYYHNITGKKALVMTGGAAGMPVTIATMQMGIGCIYALFLWAAPDARKFPRINFLDVTKMIPVAFCNAGVHGFSSFATSAGAVSFGQMVKAAEPVFAAVLGTSVYDQKVSTARWLCLIPIIGGVCLASVSELNFAWLAFGAASIANVFAAFKGNENAKLMASGEIRDKLETVGNQFAVTTLCSFLVLLPVMILKEGSKWGQFVTMLTSSPVFAANFVVSGLLLYGYNECATMTIKKTSAMTQSVANTAKRAVVIVGSAIVFGESLGPVKLIGCGIALLGVLMYSIIDSLLHNAARKRKELLESPNYLLLDSQPADCLEALRCMAECVGEGCAKCKNAMCGI